MELPIGIKPLELPDDEWTNAHQNFTQKLKKDASFELTVSDPEFKQKYPTFKEKYNKITENFQWLIKHAIDNKIRLRAMGSGWSLSKVAVSEDGIINTKKLTLKAELAAVHLSDTYLQNGGDPTNLLFAQCGNEIIRINSSLEKEQNPAKSLCMSGGSNGQTIVGAFSTGTHGAAFQTRGSLCDCVVAMHIIVGPDRHIWLERASYPVTSSAFHEWTKAEVIRNDELFNAALVSFGSFGFIHSVIIKVEPKFLLVQQLQKVPYNLALENAIKFNDFSGLIAKLKLPVEQLYHFELAINPHNFKQDGQTEEVYLRLMYKQPYQPNYTPFDPNQNGKFTYGDDVLGIIQSVLDRIEKLPGKIELKLIPKTVNELFEVAYDRPESAIGTIGETFRNTIFRGQLFSSGFAFDQKDIPVVTQLFLKMNKELPFTGVMAFRFVKGTQATLGFCKFEHSCVLELDGADTELNYQFIELFAQKLESENIPYTVHWGKINRFLNKERVRRIYGDTVIESWLSCRRSLLNENTRKVFNNEFLKHCGLDENLEDIV
ncbi:FAD-binding oxidoreductase [Adhaeribacter arboris]|nr:FAD-linked oxidase [Adhaeribacter arboris]